MRRALTLSALAVLTFLFPVPADADYRHMSRLEVIAAADVIVMGTVTRVNDTTIDLRIDHAIHGPVGAGQTILVRKFYDWPCAWRWGPYQIGERLLMFLGSRHDATGMYRILGAGDEGETPIVDAKADAYEDVPNKARGYDQFRNGPLAAGSLAQVRAAVRDLRFAYRFTFATPPRYVPGGWGVYAAFDRIDRATTRPAPGEFKKRYPPGMEVPYLPFEHRSPIHHYLYNAIQAEKRLILAAPPPAPPLRPDFARIRAVDVDA
jgi:hypothetical protein